MEQSESGVFSRVKARGTRFIITKWISKKGENWKGKCNLRREETSLET